MNSYIYGSGMQQKNPYITSKTSLLDDHSKPSSNPYLHLECEPKSLTSEEIKAKHNEWIQQKRIEVIRQLRSTNTPTITMQRRTDIPIQKEGSRIRYTKWSISEIVELVIQMYQQIIQKKQSFTDNIEYVVNWNKIRIHQRTKEQCEKKYEALRISGLSVDVLKIIFSKKGISELNIVETLNLKKRNIFHTKILQGD